MTSFKTIEQHLIELSSQYPQIPGNITNILYNISLASKMIRKEIIVAGLQSQHESGTTNVHGEHVKTLDLTANKCLIDILSAHGQFSYIGSEEEDEIVTIESETKEPYVIFFDPLDGSSNIDVNVSVGTIFSVYKTPEKWKTNDLHPGSEQLLAGYVIYGSSVMLVYTTGNGVFGFTYDPSIGEFLLSHENITIPDTPKYYSINESLYPSLSAHEQQTLDSFKTSEQGPLSSRYVGSLVADFHRNLLKGGVFAYPSTAKSTEGKLRLMYEANPLAFICEQAGGSASNGSQNILEIQPQSIHAKTPLFIGNSSLVNAFNKTTKTSK
ncbi:class 1 fructose-bisphosphatase [Candidatus Marinamargulisbacteria bacterium SCGC AG-343-D04]|nr:class 1 fructose-bisphosphatase [Candidatus Marinamargulisbacteria bacterium SCGC AG-343-D04]